jgi:hypothetical protein
MAQLQSLDELTLTTIAEAVRTGQCVLFLGAGVHAPSPDPTSKEYPPESRPPFGAALSRQLARLLLKSKQDMALRFHEECSWRLRQTADLLKAEVPSLLDEVQRLLDTPVLDEDVDLRGELLLSAIPNLARVAMYFEMNFDRNRLVDEVKAAVHGDGQKLKQPSPMLKLLSELDFPVVITTNYDVLFERALTAAGKSPIKVNYHRSNSVRTQDYRGMPSTVSPLIQKLHGDIIEDPDSIVITDEDYIQFILRMRDLAPYRPLGETAQYYLSKWPILFIGYSLVDYNLRLLLRTIWDGMDVSARPTNYSVDLRPDPIVVALWDEGGTNVDFIVENLWAFVPALHSAVNGAVV